jgi:hypothetical protein
MPLGELPAAAPVWPKRCRKGPAAGHSSSPRHAANGTLAGAAGGQISQRRLETLLGGHQLARQLSVQIAPTIDVANERFVLLQRAGRGFACALRRRAQGRQLRTPFLERDPRILQVVDAPLVRRDPIPVAPGDGRHHAGGLTDTSGIGGGEKETQVSALPELVELDEPRTKSWKVRLFLSFEPHEFLIERVQFGGGPFFVVFGLPELLILDLPFDLEPPQVTDQGARLRREAIRFLVERLQALARGPGQGLGAGAVVLLCAARRRNRQQENEKEALHGVWGRRKL